MKLFRLVTAGDVQQTYYTVAQDATTAIDYVEKFLENYGYSGIDCAIKHIEIIAEEPSQSVLFSDCESDFYEVKKDLFLVNIKVDDL